MGKNEMLEELAFLVIEPSGLGYKEASKAFNWLYTHHAEIEAMARDAARYAELCHQIDAAILPEDSIYDILDDSFEMGSGALSIHLDAAIAEHSSEVSDV